MWVTNMTIPEPCPSAPPPTASADFEDLDVDALIDSALCEMHDVGDCTLTDADLECFPAVVFAPLMGGVYRRKRFFDVEGLLRRMIFWDVDQAAWDSVCGAIEDIVPRIKRIGTFTLLREPGHFWAIYLDDVFYLLTTCEAFLGLEPSFHRVNRCAVLTSDLSKSQLTIEPLKPTRCEYDYRWILDHRDSTDIVPDGLGANELFKLRRQIEYRVWASKLDPERERTRKREWWRNNGAQTISGNGVTMNRNQILTISVLGRRARCSTKKKLKSEGFGLVLEPG